MDKFTKAVARLIELTQKGDIRWERGDPPDFTASGDYAEVVFRAEYDGERLRVFRRRSKVALDEERFDWVETPVLQVLDEDGKSLYQFPHMPALYDLIESVEYQVAGVGPLIEKLASGA